MRKGKFLYSVIYLTVLFALSGCGGSLSVGARDDGKSDVSLFMDTGKAASRMIGAIMASLYPGTGGSGSALFTPERADALAKGLSGPDVESVTAEALSSSVLSLKAAVRSASGGGNGGAGDMFSSLVTQDDRSLSLTLSPATMAALYGAMDAGTRSYVDLFMAPAFTGEQMSGEEYAALVGSVYGSPMADEISSAVIDITLAAPKGRKIASCSSDEATISGRRATFSVPLLTLLTLDEELSYGIGW